MCIGYSLSGTAQIRISSPYSYYGLGELQNTRSAYRMSMGGIGNAVRIAGQINTENPASYTVADSNSFVFDLGVLSRFSQLKTNTSSQGFTNHTSLNYLLFGFPVARWCGVSAGLMPFSKTGYQVVIKDTIDNIGQVTQKFDGSGGVNQAYIGVAFKPFKNFSLGINVNYLFGSVNKNISVYTPDLSYSYNIRTKNDAFISSFYFNYGLQYQINLKKNYQLLLGTKFSLPMNITSKYSRLTERFTASGDIESIKDTIQNIPTQKGKIYIPLSIGGGFVFAQKNKWMVGVDFDWYNWKKFESYGLKDSINNSYVFKIGGEYTPKNSGVGKYWKRMSYRAGFHYGKTYVFLNNAKIDDLAASIGFGFPISRLKTMINFSVEAGKRGNISSNLIQETYINFTLGFSFREFWFYRPKLN